MVVREIIGVELNGVELTGGTDLGGVELGSVKKATPHGARRRRTQGRAQRRHRGWAGEAAAARRGQEHARFEMKHPSVRILEPNAATSTIY